MWAILDPEGWMGHGGTCLMVAGIHLSLYYGSATPLCLVSSWIHYEIYLLVLSSWTLTRPTPGSFYWDCRRGFGGPLQPFGYVYAPPVCAFSFHIGTDSQFLQRKSTKKCNMFPNPIIWNLGSPVQAHHSAKEM